MKCKILLLGFLMGSIPFVGYSQMLPIAQFYAKNDSVMKAMEYEAVYKDRNYAKLIEINSKIKDNFNRLGEKDKLAMKGMIAEQVYYNNACWYSLQKKKKSALENFKKAVELGYKNVGHASVDTDLDFIRKDARFVDLIKKMEKLSFLSILRGSGNYVKEEKELPRFVYATPNDSNLVQVRKFFNLDSIAGSGDEISKIKNLMYWVHNSIRHDGNSLNPKRKDAIALYQICKKEGRGINCRMMAIMLNECYLSMGWKSRYVTCMPVDSTDYDCHVINAVYSNTLDKWIWMDPTFAAYVSDEKGNLLGLSEVRERLVNGAPLVLNEDANWNHQNQQTKEEYLYNYMAKNLYQMECPVEFRYGQESVGGHRSPYIILVSGKYNTYRTKDTKYMTQDADRFWTGPY